MKSETIEVSEPAKDTLGKMRHSSAGLKIRRFSGVYSIKKMDNRYGLFHR
ncbi:MAG: hypothetical protein NTX49_07660 [Chlamydiae bacterium]|nr:hypothetical protein [Chlamydiota bacterium]